MIVSGVAKPVHSFSDSIAVYEIEKATVYVLVQDLRQMMR